VTRAKEFVVCVGLDISHPLLMEFFCHRADAQNTSQTFLTAGDKPWIPPQSGAMSVLFPMWCQIGSSVPVAMGNW